MAKRKSTKTVIRRNNKLTDPSWEGWEKMSGAEYHRKRQSVLDFYNYNFKAADLMGDVWIWMKENGFTSEDVNLAKKGSTYVITSVHAYYARAVNKGMPDYVKEHDEYWQSLEGTSGVMRPVSEFLKVGINEAIQRGKLIKEEEQEKEEASNKPVVNIQTRIRNQSVMMCEFIEEELDSLHADFKKYKVADFKPYNKLKEFGVTQAHARVIKDIFISESADYRDLYNGIADEDLKEGYSHLKKTDLKKLLEFFDVVSNTCDSIIAEGKSARAPRKRKAVPPSKIVAKLKYCKEFEELKLKSISPVEIVGSKELYVYNVKTRKLGRYIADEYLGELSVKGTTIVGFSASNSIQKTLRKPAEQMKDFMSATKPNTRKFLDKVKTVDIKLNGRINPETILLKVM